MLNALNTAATGMTAQTKQIEVVANNLANADTTSFKKSRADFQDLLYQNVKDPGAATSATTRNPTGVQVGTGVQVVGTSRMYEMGTPRPSQRDLDVMIGGAGFFAVQMPDGNLAYTRDGNFQIGPEGQLQTSSGHNLAPEIAIPQNAQSVQIAEDGTVKAVMGPNEVQELGQIQLATFANPSGLVLIGSNLAMPSPSSGAPAQAAPGDPGVGKLMQRYLESSNVQPTTEMTDMIRAQRVYELNSKVISTSDQMLSTLNQIR